jgi:hypothetical protein
VAGAVAGGRKGIMVNEESRESEESIRFTVHSKTVLGYIDSLHNFLFLKE